MGNGPVERDNPKKGVIKSGEFKGEEVVFTPNGDIRFTGNDSAGGTSGDPGTTYRNLGNGKYGSSRGLLDVEPKKEVAEESSGGREGSTEQQASGQGLLADYNPEYVRYNQGGLLGQGLTTEQITGGPLHPGQDEWIYQVNPNHQVAPDLGVYTLPDFRIV
jgi:hypothetical protein